MAKNDIDRDISLAKNDIDRDISLAKNDIDRDISLVKNDIDREGIFEEAERGFVILKKYLRLNLVYSGPSLPLTFLTKERVSAFNISS